jgi:hypothetical protein
MCLLEGGMSEGGGALGKTRLDFFDKSWDDRPGTKSTNTNTKHLLSLGTKLVYSSKRRCCNT